MFLRRLGAAECGVLVPKMSVYPSGAAFATCVAAIVPLAPGFVSTTMLCRRAAPSGCAMTRAMVSLAAPGPNGTTMVMGRGGEACAHANRKCVGRKATPAARCKNFRRGSFNVFLCAAPIVYAPACTRLLGATLGRLIS